MINSKYEDIWKRDINQLSKAELYKIHKTEIKIEDYLKVIKNCKHRKALTRLRLSCHQLMIEKGRHQKPFLERSLRKCKICVNKIEDEAHFLLECPLYEKEREPLIDLCIEQAPIHFIGLTTREKYIFIMSNENPNLLNIVGKYVFNSFQIHDEWSGWGLLN